MKSADSLSQRQERILDYIREFMVDHGYPPAIRDIQSKLQISSTSVVAYNLKALETKGLIERENNVSRGIKLSGAEKPMLFKNTTYQVPLRGVITAGQPLPDPEDTSSGAEMIDVPSEMASPDKLKDVYALRVRGQSMIDALIDDGDIVLLRYQETAENGQMVAAMLVDENAVTLKKFYKDKDGSRVRLQPANSTMDPIYTTADNVRIQGRVVGVIRAMF